MIPLGNLTGLGNQLDGIAAMMKNAPQGIMGDSAISPPKQFPSIDPFGDQQAFGTPTKQIPSMGFEDTSFGATPTKQMPQELAGPSQGTAPPGLPGPGQMGSVGSLGGQFGVLDQYNNAFNMASSKYGIDANWLKAIAATERGWEGTSVAGAQGIMQIMAGGYPELEAQYPNWRNDATQNIMLGAAILNAKRREQGGDLNRGTMGYLGFGTDAYGTTSDQYLASVNKYYGQLQQSGGSFGGAQPINGQWGGNAVGNSIVNIAQQYLGIPYGWGGIPGKGDDPRTFVGPNGPGWDCSGFTYWLDQNYGSGNLPAGSHYQFQQAQQSGRLFMNMSQLQPGDLIFFDTGNTAGGGAELNRAGHVAMYIGNGQIIHAANPDSGTIISPLSDYYTSRFIGATHMQWSGGGGGYAGGTTGGYAGHTDTRGYGSVASQIRNWRASR